MSVELDPLARKTKRGNPLYHPGIEATSSAHLIKSKAKATGLDRQRIDFELAHRSWAERRKGAAGANRERIQEAARG